MAKLILTSYDKDKVHLAKAILPFLIILHHCSYLSGLGFFTNLGILLVSLFFLMSGYGLMTSYMKWGGQYLKSFFSKRIQKIMIPYLLSLVAWLIYKLLRDEGVSLFYYFISNNIGNWLPNTWFVWVLLVAYFLFWVIFQLKLSLRNKLILFAAVALGYYVLSNSLGIAQYWYRSSFCIALGMIWRYNEVRILRELNKTKVYYTLPIICIGLFLVFSKIHLKDITPLFTCAFFVWLMYSLKYPNANRGILFLSKISYEVYLLQCIAISLVCYFTEITYIAILLIFVFDIVTAYFIQALSCFIIKKI